MRRVKRLLGRVTDLYAKHAVAIDLILITAGAAAIKRRLEDVHGRLDVLEERGLVPMDDIVTLRDLGKVERVLKAHHRVLDDAGLLPEDPQPPIDVDIIEERHEADPEAPTAEPVSTGPQEGEEGP